MKHLHNISIFDWQEGNYKLKEKEMIEALDEFIALQIKFSGYSKTVKEQALQAVDEWNAIAHNDIIAQIFLEQKKPQPKVELSLFDIAAVLGKAYGYHINPKTISVVEWYSHLNMIQNGSN